MHVRSLLAGMALALLLGFALSDDIPAPGSQTGARLEQLFTEIETWINGADNGCSPGFYIQDFHDTTGTPTCVADNTTPGTGDLGLIDTEAEFEAELFPVVVPGENNDSADDLSDDSLDALSDLDSTKALTAKVRVANYTQSGSPHALTTLDTHCSLVTNAGATGALEFDLPAADPGLCVTVMLVAAQDVDVDPAAGDVLLTLADTAGESISSDATIGSKVSLVAVDSTNWMPLGITGTWDEETP